MTLSPDSTTLDGQLGYLGLRLTMGVNILVHGAGRIFGSGAADFATTTAGQFSNTPLPAGLVHAFLLIVPFAELVLGMLLTLGLLSRWALMLGSLLIGALVFGTALRADWNTVGVQMVYAIIYYVLLLNRSDNRFSLDALNFARNARRSRESIL